MDWIDVIIDVPAQHRVAAASFWSAASGWPLGPPEDGHPEFASFVPEDGPAYLHLQTLADEQDRARVHPDFRVLDVEAEAERLVGLGATVQPRPGDWLPMRSPGGLPFCLLPTPTPATRPEAVQQANGALSRLVQLCIDSPSGLHDAEVEFWRAATGWRHEPTGSAEFSGKLHGEAPSPVRLLLQRLDDDAPETVTRAHIDLGADDRTAEATRLEALGATVVGPGDGWISLRDPVGLPFCVTGVDPR